MHITLIRPPTVLPSEAKTTSQANPPLGVAYLAGTLLQAGHQVDLIDAIGSGIMEYAFIPQTHLLVHGLTIAEIIPRISSQTDVIGISAMFSNEWFYVKRLIAAIRHRFPDLPIIAGGEAITADPLYIMETCPELNYGVLGEGEETLLAWVQELEQTRNFANVAGLVYRNSQGNILKTSVRARIRNLDAIPLPAWELVPLENYLERSLGMGPPRGRPMPILASRGCPYRCTFCSNAHMWSAQWLARSPELVVEEMGVYITKYQANTFDFYDATAIINREWIISFCQLLIAQKLEVTWSLPSGTRSEAIDAEVAGWLYAAGCRNLCYAPESGSPATLKRIKKQIHLPVMLKSMRACVKHGLIVKANVIMGFPGQTKYEAWQSLKFIARMALVGVQDVGVFQFVPYPGSELFEELVAAGQIDKTARSYEQFLVDNIYNSAAEMKSWSEYISSRMLWWFTLGGMLFFYALMFLLRPWRIFQTIGHFITGQHVTMFERVLDGVIKNSSSKKRRAKIHAMESET